MKNIYLAPCPICLHGPYSTATSHQGAFRYFGLTLGGLSWRPSLNMSVQCGCSGCHVFLSLRLNNITANRVEREQGQKTSRGRVLGDGGLLTQGGTVCTCCTLCVSTTHSQHSPRTERRAATSCSVSRSRRSRSLSRSAVWPGNRPR